MPEGCCDPGISRIYRAILQREEEIMPRQGRGIWDRGRGRFLRTGWGRPWWEHQAVAELAGEEGQPAPREGRGFGRFGRMGWGRTPLWSRGVPPLRSPWVGVMHWGVPWWERPGLRGVLGVQRWWEREDA